MRGSSPRMTISVKSRSRLQRRAAQKFGCLHRRLAGALQFDDPDRALAAGDRKPIVEHRAGRARAARQLAAQNLDPRSVAAARDLAPRARKWGETMDVAEHGARRPAPIDPRLGLVDL